MVAAELPLKAFLSHSSKDKNFVEAVFRTLGAAQAEYDQATFDVGRLNAENIFSSLERSAVFVLFLSKNSISSPFVTEEQRLALEMRGRGAMRRILILAIDHTSFNALPSWLRDINVAQHLSTPKACARRIQTILLQTQAEFRSNVRIFVGRNEEKRDLTEALAQPSGSSPIALAIAGHDGIGRRTFANEVLTSVFPNLGLVPPQITLGSQDSIDDLFRKLYGVLYSSSVQTIVDDFESFVGLSYSSKISRIINLVEIIHNGGEVLFLNDEGGMLTNEGHYQQYIIDSLKPFGDAIRPIAVFIHNRMPPFSYRATQKRIYFCLLKPFNDEDIKSIMGLRLKQYNIPYDSEQIDNLIESIEGHPFNVNYIVGVAKSYGLEQFFLMRDEFNAWRRRRANEFINQIEFSETDKKIMSIISQFRFVPIEMLVNTIESSQTEISISLRNLEDSGCIERNQYYYRLSSPLRDAIQRDSRFQMDKDLRQKTAQSVVEVVAGYKNDDNVSVELIEVGITASIVSGESDKYKFLTDIILPSHFLRLARQSYDRNDHKLAVDLCEQALSREVLLTEEGKIEALRIRGLSLARLRERGKLKDNNSDLRRVGSKYAKIIAFFLEGFDNRLAGDLDGAESAFLKGYSLGHENYHIMRELAQVYLRQGRFAEAETYARKAHEFAPTNPFQIDMLISVLVGKAQCRDEILDSQEIRTLMKDLERYDEKEGRTFFLAKQADLALIAGNITEALEWADKAVQLSPNRFTSLMTRAQIRMKAGDLAGVSHDLDLMKTIIDDSSTGEGKSWLVEYDKIKIRLYLEQRRYRDAKKHLYLARQLPKHVFGQMMKQIVVAIKWDQNFRDHEIIQWAGEQKI